MPCLWTSCQTPTLLFSLVKINVFIVVFTATYQTPSVHQPLSPGLSSSDKEYLVQTVAKLDADFNPCEEEPVPDIVLIDKWGDAYDESMSNAEAPTVVALPASPSIIKTLWEAAHGDYMLMVIRQTGYGGPNKLMSSLCCVLLFNCKHATQAN
ncbi:uncharacterized protein MELLADRAFT_111134 [Melampsora larici-populina 98AG31]|uniref:Uncharacterized protein n=1 Tax=Melampsora larici-populina (strain 98AG31 / pathotype 3-4-7) TaxID=747676 RepID=F4S250_MELLP|nr:uncharacterized protein MELLADRAFT_111134 [Melampsora larici-populina 98AG31]EGG01321.1 hypothetical protein MELLADRAFT_111134 [Melampsora larici-populina 98AG31]